MEEYFKDYLFSLIVSMFLVVMAEGKNICYNHIDTKTQIVFNKLQEIRNLTMGDV